MAVLPVIPVAPAPSSRSQSNDGPATDPSGFGSLLGGLDASSPDSGGSAGGTSSGASAAPAYRTPAKPHPSRSDSASGGTAAARNDRDESGTEAASGQPAKDAEPAKSAPAANGGKGLHLARGHDKQAQGKDKAAADSDQTDDGTQAAAAVAQPAGAASPVAVAAAGAAVPGATAGAAITPDATGVAPAAAAAAADAAPAGVIPADLTPALASPAPAAAAADAGVPVVDAAPQGAAAAAPDAANAKTAFGSAVLEASLSVSPLTGNPAAPPVSEAPAPSIAATLLASLKSPTSGGAPAAALAPTAASPQSVAAAPPSPPIQMPAVPEVSAAPSATPQSSIAPGIAAIASLLPEAASDATPIIIQSLPARAVMGANAPLHGKANANGTIATGLPAASFGSASVAPGGIAALSAALLGGSDDQLPDLSDGELTFADPELLETHLPDELAKSGGEAEAAESTTGSEPAGLIPSSFAAALARSDTLSPSSSHGTPAQASAAPPSTMPPMPALQIMPSLAKAAGDGGGHFNIQLHPQELGRVRVELDIDHDGHVTAAISAAHPATLDLLRRDAQALQQALNDAGLKTDGNALSFNLQGGGQDMAERSGRSSRSNGPVVPPAVDPLADAAPGPASSVSLGAGLVAVDIRI